MRLLFMFLLLTHAYYAIGQTPRTLHVKSDATGNADGTSWQNAYTDLQSAIDAADANDLIWVTSGTYNPAADSLLHGFVIEKDIKLYGGFSGVEFKLEDRSSATSPTILSGDLIGNDEANIFDQNRSDNTKHVLTIAAAVSASTIIDGFIIQGGHADGGGEDVNNQVGGGILSLGAATIKNCHFIDNYASISGGGIYHFAAGSTLIDSCSFDGNQAGGSGGAIYHQPQFDSIQLTIANSSFSENEASDDGGAILLNQALNYSKSEIRYCYFTKNQARDVGGSIYSFSYSDSTSLVIKHSTFSSNIAINDGGAIFSEHGGLQNHTSVISSIFLENSASDVARENVSAGGAIRGYSAESSVNSIHDIDSCQFRNNMALDLGGAMQWETFGLDGAIKIESSEFQENETDFGGAFHCAIVGPGASIKIESSEFQENDGYYGGAIYYYQDPAAFNSELLIRKSQLNMNHSYGNGGAIYSAVYGRNQRWFLDSLEFTDNQTSGFGGAIYNYTVGDSLQSIYKNLYFGQNKATEGGGVFDYQAGQGINWQVTGTRFESNEVSQIGGGFVCFQDGKNNQFALQSSVFSNNQAINNFFGGSTIGGGFRYLMTDAVTGIDVVVDSCEFLENKTSNFGGGCLIDLNGTNNQFKFTRSLFQSNSAEWGGAIYVFNFYEESETNHFSVATSDFQSNRGGYSGGAVFFDYSGKDIRSTFTQNHFFNNQLDIEDPNSSGGAISYTVKPSTENAVLEVADCTFELNTTKGAGGAAKLNLEGTNTHTTFSNNIFLSNTADDGAALAIYCPDFFGHELLVSGSDFEDNLAKEEGVIHVSGSGQSNITTILDNCRFIRNRGYHTAGIYMQNTDWNILSLQLRNTIFHENQSLTGGALIELDGREDSFCGIEVASSQFTENFARIYQFKTANNYSAAQFSKSIFKRNNYFDGNILSGFHSSATEGGQASVLYDNCLFAYNDFGERPLFACDSSLFLQFINCTIAENASVIISADESSRIDLQNSILFNPGTDSYRTSGLPAGIKSLGGNLVFDHSLDRWLTQEDFIGVDPKFDLSSEPDFQLSAESPAIDQGIIPSMVPQFDLLGNLRVQGASIDIGAYEKNTITAISSEKRRDVEQLRVYPLPFRRSLTANLDDPWTGMIQVSLFDSHGKLVKQLIIQKDIPVQSWSFHWGDLPSGAYLMVFNYNQKKLTQKIIKY